MDGVFARTQKDLKYWSPVDTVSYFYNSFHCMGKLPKNIPKILKFPFVHHKIILHRNSIIYPFTSSSLFHSFRFFYLCKFFTTYFFL